MSKSIWVYAHKIDCRVRMETRSQISWDVHNNWQNMMVQPPQAHSHRKNENNGKDWNIDASSLMMIIRWFTNISSQSPKLEWGRWTHTDPFITKIKKVTERMYYILDTHPTDYTQRAFMHACRCFTVCFQCLWANICETLHKAISVNHVMHGWSSDIENHKVVYSITIINS